MINVLGFDITEIKPVEAMSYYGDVNILDTGSMRPTEPLSDDLIVFLRKIGDDISLWDGSKGVLGRQYASVSSRQVPITQTEAFNLRSQYLEVKASLASDGKTNRLKRDLEVQTKMHRQLNNSVFEMEQRAEQLAKEQGEIEIMAGALSQGYGTLAKKLEDISEELESCRAAAARMHKKLQQTRVDIAESETGYMRKIAILLRMSSCKYTTEKFVSRSTRRSKQMTDTVIFAKDADERSLKATTEYLHTKRFYVDAKVGLKHLFKVESTLKEILQHLGEGMKCLHGSADNVSHLPPSEKGFEFRVGYVRKLWGIADSSFKTSLPYIKYSSLRYSPRPPPAENEGPSLRKKASRQYSGSGGKKVGLFENVPCLLPSFTKIELSHPLSRRSRIAALHKTAALAYKDMNALYDFHEKMVEETLVVLRKKEEEDLKANDELIALWEDILDISG